VKKIKILLANRPRMMRELVRELIERQKDEEMEVVGEVLDPLDILVAVREMEADAVILAMRDSEEPGLCSHLLAEYPDLTIVGIASEGESAFIEQRTPQRQQIPEVSGANILTALRHAARAASSLETSSSTTTGSKTNLGDNHHA